MAFSVVHETFHLRGVTAENRGETVVQGTFSLPGGSAEIGRGHIVKAFPQTISAEVRDGRVIFEGALSVRFLYSSFDEKEIRYEEEVIRDELAHYDDDQGLDDTGMKEIVIEETLHVADGNRVISFAYALECPGAVEEMPVKTDVQVSGASFEVRPDRMSIDIDAVVVLSAECFEYDDVTVATGVVGDDGVKTETKSVRVVNVLGEGKATADVSGPLDFEGKPVPQKVLWIDAKPEIRQTVLADDKARLSGVVHYEGLYIGENSSDVRWAEWPAVHAFQVDVDVLGAKHGADARVKVATQRPEIKELLSAETPTVEVRTPLSLEVAVCQPRKLDVVTHIDADMAEVAMRHREIRMTEQVGEATQTDDVVATFELPEGKVPIDRVLFGDARVTIDDVHVLGDRVAVSARVDVDMAYTAVADEEGALQTVSWPDQITFDVEVPLPGAEPGLDRKVWADVAMIAFDLLHRHGVEVRLRVDTSVTLSRDVALNVVDDAVTIPVMDEFLPTFTYVVIEPNDTLWRLAAYYRSEPGKIVDANDWLHSEEDSLEVGRKLCIPHK